MTAVDRLVGADIPPEPGPGSVAITVDQGRAFQHLRGCLGMARWFGIPTSGGGGVGILVTWTEILANGPVRIVWEPTEEPRDVPA